MASSIFFVWGTPQANTITVSKIHGSQALNKPVGMVSTPGLWRAEAGASFGRQNFNSTTNAPIDISDPTMSVSHGPWKFETRNCGIANATPAVNAAGQTPSIPRQPAYAHTTQNGTITEKNGNCLPTIADSSFKSNPVTVLKAMIGVPSAPYATGAVFAVSDKPDAS